MGFFFILNDDLKASFQDGVDALYNKCKGLGFTPAGKTPTNITDTIAKIYTDRYNSGVTDADARCNTSSKSYTDGYAAGRTQGQNDVKADPTAYGISTTPHTAYIGSIGNALNEAVKTFDVKHIPGYQNLTVRNFYIIPTASTINYKTSSDEEKIVNVNRYMEDNDGYGGDSNGPKFQYDAANGILKRGPIKYIHSIATAHFSRITIGGDIYCIY